LYFATSKTTLTILRREVFVVAITVICPYCNSSKVIASSAVATEIANARGANVGKIAGMIVGYAAVAAVVAGTGGLAAFVAPLVGGVAAGLGGSLLGANIAESSNTSKLGYHCTSCDKKWM
jgi:hypothetical protein